MNLYAYQDYILLSKIQFKKYEIYLNSLEGVELEKKKASFEVYRLNFETNQFDNLNKLRQFFTCFLAIITG